MINQPTLSTKDEFVIWEGSQSQILNIGNFILALIMAGVFITLSIIFPLAGFIFSALMALPIIFILWKIILIRSVKYQITNQRVVSKTGIFSKQTEMIELYRVRDLEVFEPFLFRIFGKGNLKLITADTSTPSFMLRAIPNPQKLFDELRIAVEKRRDDKRVRGIEFEQTDEVV